MDKVFAALETFRIELPSWGFANTGTRFGKFIQAAAAITFLSPGMRFFYDGQFDGARVRVPTHLCRGPVEPTQAARAPRGIARQAGPAVRARVHHECFGRAERQAEPQE